MSRKLIIFFTLSLFFLGFINKPAIAAIKNLPRFYKIKLSGPISVIIKTAKGKRANSITTSRGIISRVTNNTLYISTSSNYQRKHRATLTVKLHRLTGLSVSNGARITGDLHTNALIIIAKNHGPIKLKGEIGVRHIQDNGPGKISIRWVNSHRLDIYATRNSHLKLAGRIHSLVARLNRYSKLNAQYLRADNVMIQTSNRATAKVLPVKSLRAFAYNNSNIYYYKRPKYLTRNTYQNGNVLLVAERN